MSHRIRQQGLDDAAMLNRWTTQTGAVLPAEPADGDISLVLIDDQQQAKACLRLRPRLGLTLPRYSFHLGRIVHASSELGLFRVQPTLLLGNDHTGESELADLACAPELVMDEQVEALSLLVQAALAHIAADRETFGDRLIVELAGTRDEAGTSPFWQGLGQHFYVGDPAAAQAELGEAWRSHLSTLLPKQALYLSFLSEAAQAAAGQLGEAGQAAARALRRHGFAVAQHLRIDDGGPIFERTL